MYPLQINKPLRNSTMYSLLKPSPKATAKVRDKASTPLDLHLFNNINI